jgi:actin related protein 2/3 complex subunit 1A/1B
LQDCEVHRLQGDENGWQLAGSFESKRGQAGAAREESALNMFRQMDLRGQAQSNTKLDTVHQNTISTVRVYEEQGGHVKKFSSKYFERRFKARSNSFVASGVDGRVVVWTI